MKNHQLHPRLQFTTVREVLAWASETHKDKTAYSYREKASDKEILKVSFEKLHRDATALAFVGIRLLDDKKLVYGAGSHPDIARTAVAALVSALNCAAKNGDK